MKQNILLFKNFINPLPTSFVNSLYNHHPEATTLLVDDTTLDFNRWELSLRINQPVVNFILDYNKKNDNILDEHIKFINTDVEKGYIQCDSDTKEECWIMK